MRLEHANIICPKCGNGNYMRHLIGKGVGKLDMKCINCNSYFSFDELYKAKIAEVVKPRTNYDRIISKSPEELAAQIVEWIEGIDPISGTLYDNDTDKWLDWLKQEATDGT